jgi:UDP-glucose 4-epimerase
VRLLVTGGAGYIGSIVSELAVGAGHDAVVIDDLRAGNRAAVPLACPFVEGSIGDPAVLVASAALVRQRLGWSPALPALDDIVRSAWQWREEHPQGYRAHGDPGLVPV